MKIANADKLKKHCENVVDVKLFTVPEICTIIDTFSIEFPEDARVIMPRHMGRQMVYDNMAKLMNIIKPGIDNNPLSEEQTDVPRLPLQVIPE